MVKNIRFEYADNVPNDKGREEFMTSQLNRWLKEYEEKLNDENGIVSVTIGTNNQYNFEFVGISDELRNSIDINQHPITPPNNLR